MDPIVKRLKENRMESLTKEVTKVRSDFFHVLYESKMDGTLSYTGSMMLEAFEENPEASVEDIHEEEYIPNEEELEEDMSVTDVHVMKDKGKSVVSLKIGGVEYRYISPNMTAEQLLSKFNSIAKYSTGRAFAWLKKNSVLYYNGRLKRYENKKVSEDMEIPEEDKKKKSLVRSEVHPVSTADKPNIADAVTEGVALHIQDKIADLLNKNTIIDGEYRFSKGVIYDTYISSDNGGPWVKNRKVGTYTIDDKGANLIMVIKDTSNARELKNSRFPLPFLSQWLSAKINRKIDIEIK